jgi:hypothetical protein
VRPYAVRVAAPVPHIYELTRASLSKDGNGADSTSSAPFARSDDNGVLGNKLIDVVVVAVVHAVDVL